MVILMVTGQSDHDNLHVMGYITCAVNDQIDLRVYACDSGKLMFIGDKDLDILLVDWFNKYK